MWDCLCSTRPCVVAFTYHGIYFFKILLTVLWLTCFGRRSLSGVQPPPWFRDIFWGGRSPGCKHSVCLRWMYRPNLDAVYIKITAPSLSSGHVRFSVFLLFFFLTLSHFWWSSARRAQPGTNRSLPPSNVQNIQRLDSIILPHINVGSSRKWIWSALFNQGRE